MKVGLMFHGSRETRDTVNLDEHRLGPTASAFRDEGLEVAAVVYNDDFAEEVREQLLRLDGVQVWINPITDDGHTRAKLDDLLGEVASKGVLISSHPDVIQKIGTKKVLFDTRGLGWAGDVRLYCSADEMAAGLSASLQMGPRVIKQHRGHSGHGIWKVLNVGSDRVNVKPAARGSVDAEMGFGEWVESCRPYFEIGPMLDQEYNPEIARGMVRSYLVRDKVEGFGHQEVNALVPGAEPGVRLYHTRDHPDFQTLKRKVEDEWLPQLMATVDMNETELPHLWDLDFMFRGDGFMLCEINISSVYPYPDSAMQPLARSFRDRLTH